MAGTNGRNAEERCESANARGFAYSIASTLSTTGVDFSVFG